MNPPKIILTPRRPAVLAGFQNKLEVLVRIAAPDAPNAQGKQQPDPTDKP